jgi:hypothetical protein
MAMGEGVGGSAMILLPGHARSTLPACVDHPMNEHIYYAFCWCIFCGEIHHIYFLYNSRHR